MSLEVGIQLLYLSQNNLHPYKNIKTVETCIHH